MDRQSSNIVTWSQKSRNCRRTEPEVAKCSFFSLRASLLMLAFAFLITLSAVEGAPGPVAQEVQQQSLAGSPIEEDKRAAYNFGLGKRAPMPFKAWSSAFQRLFDPEMRQFAIYTSAEGAKRSKPARFNFGLGKRADETFESSPDEGDETGSETLEGGNSFPKRAAGRYEFGIGKRSPATYSRSDFDEYIKRRYAFGLGRR